MPKTKASFCVIGATLLTVIVLFVLPITPKIPVSTTVIERGSLVKTQSIEGLICYADEQPCLSLTAGQVAKVYVRQGERVQKGDVLARLDTTVEERALSGLEQAFQRQEEAAASLTANVEAVQALWLQNQLTMEQKRQELSLSIEAKTLRAASDGIVGQVYAQENGYVDAFAPLMTLHAGTVEIRAQQRFQDSASLKVGMCAMVFANGQQQAIGALKGFDVPSMDEGTGIYAQTLRFSAVEGEEWLARRMGETVSMEILWDTKQDMPLVPIAAVSQSNQMWIVKEGKASAVAVDPLERDAEFVCVPEEFVGEAVVLLPDELHLYQGCLVKEAKK